MVERYADFGAPVAQSSIDSLGRSTAFASDPYPGETFIAGPGTVAGVTGLPNPGNYPFYVATSYPATPDGALDGPGYRLQAKSEESRSASTARHGGASGESAVFFAESTSGVELTPATGAVLAQSAAVVRQVDIGGVLKIGTMNTSAKVSQVPGQEAVRESSFKVDAVSIAGQAVGISSKGLTLAGTNNPLPDGSPMMAALKSANITVQYLQAANQSGEVTSPGLVITQRFPVPQGPEMITTLVLGRAVARVAIGDAVVAGQADDGSSGDGETGTQSATAGREPDRATAPPSRSSRMFSAASAGRGSALGQWPSGWCGANGHSSKAAQRPSSANFSTHRSRQRLVSAPR